MSATVSASLFYIMQMVWIATLKEHRRFVLCMQKISKISIPVSACVRNFHSSLDPTFPFCCQFQFDLPMSDISILLSISIDTSPLTKKGRLQRSKRRKRPAPKVKKVKKAPNARLFLFLLFLLSLITLFTLLLFSLLFFLPFVWPCISNS